MESEMSLKWIREGSLEKAGKLSTFSPHTPLSPQSTFIKNNIVTLSLFLLGIYMGQKILAVSEAVLSHTQMWDRSALQSIFLMSQRQSCPIKK